MSLYRASVPQFQQMLRNLDAWLGKAVENAAARGFDADVLLTARLAPDQFALAKQVQAACDAAKLGAARLAGVEAPKHEDVEKTIPQLRARIAEVIAFLDTIGESAFEGAKDRRVVLPFIPGKWLTTGDYLNQMALPNFYFHCATAYSILRHNGVVLGKTDYIGHLTLRD